MPLSIDSETALIQPGLQAPPLACVSTAFSRTEYGLYHHTEARPIVVAALESDVLLVGCNIAFDMGVFASEWPELMPLIFEVYAADRVSDVSLREKLNHIALGVYRKFERTDGEWVHLDYSLQGLVKRHLDLQLEKGTWQLKFGELRDVPLAFWPEEAQDYAIGDAVTTLGVWESQQEDPQYLEDEFRQSRAEWWLHLMSCWGLHTDPDGVREFARMTQQKYDEIEEGLITAGLVRQDKKRTRNMKAVKERVAVAYEGLGKAPPLTKGGKSGNRQVSTSADTCDLSGDPVLENYAELSSLKHKISNDIPLLEQGAYTPLQANFETIVETGRTASSPNVQNLSTDIGVRECFVPRSGYVYASADFSGFELRTWSQVCITMGFGSRMAEALNAGNDPHLEIARRILGITYEEAEKDYENDPKGRVYNPRQSGKVSNFGYPGGLGAKTLVFYARKNYGVIIDLPTAFALKDFWLESWPEAHAYFDWINALTNRPNPQLRQLFSNRVRGNVGFCDGANSFFQGLAADAAKAAGFLVSRACYAEPDSPLFGCRIVNFVHDEFIVEVPDDELAADAAEELARLMKKGASPFLPDVPPVAKPMLARRWSKAAKPMRDANGRLIPWDFSTKQATE